MKYFKGLSFYIILFVVILIAIGLISAGQGPQQMTYTDFLDELDAGNIYNVFIDERSATVELKSHEERIVYISSGIVFGEFLQQEVDNGKTFTFDFAPEKEAPWWISILPTLGLIVIFVLFWVFFLQQSQGGGGSKVMSFGKSKAKLHTENDKKITFKDVAGEDEEKEELMEIVEFLREPKKFLQLGARIPKGVLLVGPPGTGKTLLAKAVSGEAGVPFFSISGSDFVEMFVGVGASRVRDLFEKAKKNSPCIIFIDEIDAVGRHRGAGLGGGHDEREQTLNQLLVEMDGFGANEGVIILAATNRPDILDPAILRPGRFDRTVYVGIPDIKGREAILKVHAHNKPLDDTVDLSDVAKITSGFSGADLENLLNEAALLAARRNLSRIGMSEIKESVFKVTMGPEKKSKLISEEERKLTAYHEAGHAIAVKVASSTDNVDRVSIIPSGKAGGYTSFKPDEDKSYQTKSQLFEKIIVSLGGRAAEKIIFDEISTGASGDLKMANKIARVMVTKYGMSEKLGNLIFGDDSEEVFIGRDYGHTKNYSEDIAAQIDIEVKNIIDKCYNRTIDILKDNLEKLHKLAEVLLVKEKVEGAEFEEIFAGV